MRSTGNFNIGFLQTYTDEEEMFISVTPGFEQGPGIIRDGITSPRMRDPHSVPSVTMQHKHKSYVDANYTTDPQLQRAGTWTLYDHVKDFIDKMGDEWLVTGVQSSGDLTMNQWHVAYIGSNHIRSREVPRFVAIDEDRAKLEARKYRCFVKWNDEAFKMSGIRYEALDLKFFQSPIKTLVSFADNRKHLEEEYIWLADQEDCQAGDISNYVEFALAGKPIVRKGIELATSEAIDRFTDIRHIFNLPTVRASGMYAGHQVDAMKLPPFFGQVAK